MLHDVTEGVGTVFIFNDDIGNSKLSFYNYHYNCYQAKLQLADYSVA